jgi:hypothetical protein
MKDPYSDMDGNSYEKEAIFKWIIENGNSPITRNPMTIDNLIPNRALKEAIENYLGINNEPVIDVTSPPLDCRHSNIEPLITLTS